MNLEDIIIGKNYWSTDYDLEFKVIGLNKTQVLGQRIDGVGWEIGTWDICDFKLKDSFKNEKAYYFQCRNIEEIKDKSFQYKKRRTTLEEISAERKKISTDVDYAYQIKKKSIVLEPILPIKTRVLI